MPFINPNGKNHKWWVLAAMSSCVSMIFLDQTVMPVTLPTIQKDLLVSEVGLQWLVNAYLLALTAFVLAGGRVGDIFGHRKIYCYGVVIFSCASAMCGVSFCETWFIISRTLQGIGAALLLPSTTTILVSVFPLKERGKALGIYVGVGSIFLTLGPFVGGLFTEYLTWRYVFWINLPIAALGFLLTMLTVAKSEPRKESFDFFGFFSFSIGVFLVIFALMERATWGWDSPLTLGFLAIGLVMIASLILFDRGVKNPFIDFTIFKDRLFCGSVFSVFCAQFLLMVTVFWAIYFQNVLLLTPIKAGVLTVMTTLPVVLFAPLAGFLLDRMGPRIPICVGFALVFLSLIWFVIFAEVKDYTLLIPGLLILGCGVPLIFTPSFTTSMSSVPAEKRGVASGISTTLRQFAATLGMAILGTLFLNFEHNELAYLFAKNPVTKDLSPSLFDGLLSQSPLAMEQISKFSGETAGLIRVSYIQAFKIAIRNINLVALSVSILGFLFALFFLTKELKEPMEHSTADKS